MSGIPLKVRFEDVSVRAGSGSFRQSPGWYPEDVILRKEFEHFEIDLERFDWFQDAWFSNTAPVDKQRVMQIVFGHDDSIPRCAGTIEIRRLRLLPTLAEKMK